MNILLCRTHVLNLTHTHTQTHTQTHTHKYMHCNVMHACVYSNTQSLAILHVHMYRVNYLFLLFGQCNDASVPFPCFEFQILLTQSCFLRYRFHVGMGMGLHQRGVVRVAAGKGAQILDDLGIGGGCPLFTQIQQLTQPLCRQALQDQCMISTARLVLGILRMNRTASHQAHYTAASTQPILNTCMSVSRSVLMESMSGLMTGLSFPGSEERERSAPATQQWTLVDSSWCSSWSCPREVSRLRRRTSTS